MGISAARRTARAVRIWSESCQGHQKSYRPSSEPPERPSNERLRHARFEQNTTLEEFDFAASPKLPAAQIRDLAALR
jgi:DNA replication protein DnaC